MKRFLLFCYDTYYPQGGQNDAHSSHDTLEKALAAWKREGSDFYDILDLEKREWVKSGRQENYPYARTKS